MKANNGEMRQIIQQQIDNTARNLRLPLYEIINIEDGSLKIPSIEQQNFISDYAHQCASFLTWVAQPNYNNFLPQILWKNEMRSKAGQLYTQLDNEQIKSLVDRDWRIMSQQQRNKIINKYSEPCNEVLIKNRLTQMKDRLTSIRNSMNIH